MKGFIADKTIDSFIFFRAAISCIAKYVQYKIKRSFYMKLLVFFNEKS